MICCIRITKSIICVSCNETHEDNLRKQLLPFIGVNATLVFCPEMRRVQTKDVPDNKVGQIKSGQELSLSKMYAGMAEGKLRNVR